MMRATQERRLLSLPEAVLEGILALCDQKTRASVLPLVCRTFRRLLGGPSGSLWREITFETDLSRPGQLDRAASFLAWLASHGSLAKSLQLDLWSGNFQAAVVAAPGLALYQRLEEALRASLGSCQYLRLRWGGPELVVGDWVAAAASLTCLALSAHTLRVRSDLSALTTLAHLEFSTYSDDGPQLDPGCLPPSLTRLCCVPAPGEAPVDELGGAMLSLLPDQLLALPRLEYLDVSESWFTGEHLSAALPRLTRLTSLAFDKCELPDGLPPELALLTRLRVLSFDACILLEGHQPSALAWTVLGSLTGLMSLSLSNCNLLHLPPSVASLPRMRYLYLEFNQMRSLPPGPYLRHLQVLSTDWEPLLRSHQLLLEQAPHLHKLALGSMSVFFHASEGLPPLASAGDLLASLGSFPVLQDILLIVRATHVQGTSVPVLEAILQLSTLRPGLVVQPIEHDMFFVEDAPAHAQGEEEGDDGAGVEGAAQAAAVPEVPAAGAQQQQADA